MEEEGRNPESTSSTFTHLFGPKDSSHGILASIFPPPATAPRGEPVRLSETDEKKTDSVTQPWTTAQKPVSGEEEQSWSTKEKTSYFEEEKHQPFHYSSSIYYGGQDVYSRPNDSGPKTFKKDVGEDDSGSASRGNWWQGSLYY